MVNSIAHDDANRKANNRDLLYMQLKQRRIIDSSSSAAFEIIATLLGFIFQSESLRFVVLPRILSRDDSMNSYSFFISLRIISST
jgi:hypothetical protein